MQHLPFRSVDARRLADTLTTEGAPIPSALAKAVALAAAADAARQQPHRRALDLDLEAGEHLSHAQALVLHDDKLFERLAQIADQGAREAAAELQVGAIDPVIEAMQPAFDEAAAVVINAAGLGITAKTSGEDVIARDDPRVVDAYRTVGGAISRLNEIARVRIMLSTALGLAPTLSDARNIAGSSLDVTAVDYSVCFVEPSSGAFSVDGSAYIGRRPGGGLDWLRLAPAGLHLNNTAEVEGMLATRTGTVRHVPLDEDPRVVLGREQRIAHPDDQTIYVG